MSGERVIVFDDSCPMCRLYTLGFVAVGAIKPENRVGFASVDDAVLAAIDQNRARHEIPLYDPTSGETLYGLEALLFLVGSRFPWSMPLVRQTWFRRGLKPLYWLITYNRRVMAGCRPASGFDCAPDLHVGWRSAYLGLTFLFCLSVVSWGWFVSGSFPVWCSVLIVWALVTGVTVCWPRLSRLERWNRIGNAATTAFVFCLVAGVGLVFTEGSWGQIAVWSVAWLVLIEESWRRWD